MQEQYIPIDIHTNKLLDWLISRRHCNREWQGQVLTIREKINNAIQDMPVHEGIARLLSGSYINYFHCTKIIEILKETEANSKNFFGSYGSQRMKDWLEIVRLYEKDNVYLAEAAQILVRNVNYEVPSLKKQITKREQTQAECDKKEIDYGKVANSARGEFQSLCKQLGISGDHIKKELVSKLSELPGIYQKLSKNTKSLKRAVDYYSGFVVYVLGRQHEGGCVPMVKYIIEHGNTTTYEWTYGEAPLSVEEPPLNITFDDEVQEGAVDDNIDFGEDGGGIDFGDLASANPDVIDVALEGGDIDWGIAGVPQDVQPQEIDFDISLEESGIVVESTGVEGGAAKGTDSFTVLDNPYTRNKFIDELFELEAFLKLRLVELRGTNDFLALCQMLEACPFLQDQTTQSVTDMLDKVTAIKKEITDQKTQHLYNIKHSPRYVDHLAESLQQKLQLVEKMVASQEAVRQKRREAAEQITSLQPKLKLIITKTKELQTEIQNDISKKYKNRPVNLLGGVNLL